MERERKRLLKKEIYINIERYDKWRQIEEKV
jgi:hypothetical protein